MKLNINKLFSGNARSSQVKKNIAGSIAIKGISILASLLLVPLTLNYVNKELYGIWLTLSSIILWLNFFDIGFTLGLKNKLAESLAVKDYVSGKHLVSTTYYMMIIIFLPICVFMLFITPFLNWSSILNVSPVYNSDIIKVLYILIVSVFFQMFFNVLGAVVSAYQKVAFSSLFIMLGQVLSLLFVYILTLVAPPSLIGLAIAISVSPIIILSTFSIYLYKNRFKAVSPSYKFVDRKRIKELFGMGIKFFIIQVQVIILYQSTNIIISNIAGPEAVTEYNIAYKYLGVAAMLYNIILMPLWPAFTDAYTLRDYQWMRNIYKKMCYVYIGVVIGISILVLISPYVYQIWIGKDANISTSMTVIISLFIIINSWDSLQVFMINGIGAVKLQSCVVVIGLLFHIPLAFYFGSKIGAKGVILSMICINIIYSLIFTTQINKIINKKASGIWLK
ncbi:oligosaccharide flippase family protein [Parabacteroides segnis]|uniref:oligosaccharide flippase family protein n=1 Tax=Parabacteroides segnis TaxID=2763058 RepID=UPI003516BC63